MMTVVVDDVEWQLRWDPVPVMCHARISVIAMNLEMIVWKGNHNRSGWTSTSSGGVRRAMMSMLAWMELLLQHHG